jgi:hypothetical protein
MHRVAPLLEPTHMPGVHAAACACARNTGTCKQASKQLTPNAQAHMHGPMHSWAEVLDGDTHTTTQRNMQHTTCTTITHRYVCMHACTQQLCQQKGSVLLCYGRATQQHTQHTQLALTHKVQTHTATANGEGEGRACMLAWGNLGINA